jgi:intraflagellar transport protein 122
MPSTLVQSASIRTGLEHFCERFSKRGDLRHKHWGLKAHQVMFPMVHGLYKDRYAYRDQLTDVIIQHLVTDSRVRIRGRDYVKKIALYKERLAVQLTDKIIVYSVGIEDEFDMKYKALKKINYKY